MRKIGFTAIMILMLACHTELVSQVDTKQALIESLLKNPDIERVQSLKKVIIVEAEYCLENDCVAFFKDYKDRIEIMSREYLFMRGYKKFIAIKDIDLEKGQLKAVINPFAEAKPIVIKL